MHSVYRKQWQTLLRVDQGLDRGPQQGEGSVSKADFLRDCLRCGRTLALGGQQHMWRWTGFNMGLDLIVIYDRHCISLKRNQGHLSESTGNALGNVNEHEALMATHKKRGVMLRVAVASVNEQKQITYFQSTDIKTVNLGRNSTEVVLKLKPEEAKFPLLLSFNFMVTMPANEDDSEEEEEVSVEEVQAQQ